MGRQYCTKTIYVDNIEFMNCTKDFKKIYLILLYLPATYGVIFWGVPLTIQYAKLSFGKSDFE